MTIIKLFQQAVTKKASDIHIIVGKPPILRIDGELIEIEGEPYTQAKAREDIFSILTPAQQEKFEKERDLDTSYEIPNVSRYRVNCHFEKENTGLVARVVSSTLPTMEDILMPKIAYDLVRLNQGLILVTGPTGCGKSTTLAAMIELINNERRCHIVTLEDPIEFLYQSKKSLIKQRQLGSDMLSFASGLKHVLRQDPNVILVGEMRDLETIAAAITVAETGHLVFATLHTLNAAQTVDRIIDVFPPYQQNQVRLQLSMSLRAVLSQQLLKRKNGGRIASREIMLNTPAVSNLIRENKIAQLKTVIQTSATDGMMTMDQDIKRLLDAGLIDKEVAKVHMLNPESLR
jgi:twitching motility protein PilT